MRKNVKHYFSESLRTMQKKITFAVDGQKLVGTLLTPDVIKEKHPAILLIHGWQSSEKKYIIRAQSLVELGFICLTFSMRGHGESEGNLNFLTAEDHLNDCFAAYDFLIQQSNVNKNQIGVIGSSYGGYMGCLLTQQKPIRWLALKSPANYPDELFAIPRIPLGIEDKLLKFRYQKLSPPQNRAVKALSKFRGEVLIIEAEKDEIVPKVTLTNYVNALTHKSKLTYKVIKGADHASTKEKWNQEFMHILRDWFNSLEL